MKIIIYLFLITWGLFSCATGSHTPDTPDKPDKPDVKPKPKPDVKPSDRDLATKFANTKEFDSLFKINQEIVKFDTSENNSLYYLVKKDAPQITLSTNQQATAVIKKFLEKTQYKSKSTVNFYIEKTNKTTQWFASTSEDLTQITDDKPLVLVTKPEDFENFRVTNEQRFLHISIETTDGKKIYIPILLQFEQ